jgi:hypothetical protein
MLTPNSPLKKKQYRPPKANEDNNNNVKEKETIEEKKLSQAKINTFFAGHFEAMIGVQEENKNSPKKRKSSESQQIRKTVTIETTEAEEGQTGDQEDGWDSEVSINSGGDRKIAAVNTAKEDDADQRHPDTHDEEEGNEDNKDNEDDTRSQASMLSLAEVSQVLPGKKKVLVEPDRDEDEEEENRASEEDKQQMKDPERNNNKKKDDRHEEVKDKTNAIHEEGHAAVQQESETEFIQAKPLLETQGDNTKDTTAAMSRQMTEIDDSDVDMMVDRKMVNTNRPTNETTAGEEEAENS